MLHSARVWAYKYVYDYAEIFGVLCSNKESSGMSSFSFEPLLTIAKDSLTTT